MADDPAITFGTGAIQSPPDHRDWPVADLFAAAGVAALPKLPARRTTPGIAHLNQHATPMCVAFSTSAAKTWQDAKQHVGGDLDEPRFFKLIGGGPGGAAVRTALDRLVKVGYPELGGANASRHRIRAYYTVPKVIDTIKRVIVAFGPVELAVPWYHAWFTPGLHGVLPHADYQIGGHAILAKGWDDRYGLQLHNSWGPTWGVYGDCYMPYPTVLHSVWEIWKTVDA